MRSKYPRYVRHFVSESLARDRVTLTDRSANYLANTLRLGVGAEVVLFDGKGLERAAKITTVTRGRMELVLGEPIPHQPGSPISIRLIQGLAKGEAMDMAIQKATELGAARITPVTTQYSVVKLPAERAARRLAHWQSVANSACEQCGRHYPPQIDAVQTLTECLDELEPLQDSAARFMLDPAATNSLATFGLEPASKVSLLIGPEGGLSERDSAAASAKDFVRVSLGPRILRTETAGMAACAILQSRLGDLR